MAEYYSVERSSNYLAHYGIRGMKWGVRKALKSGNSRKLGRQYAKAQKKLAKLEKRAANSSKYYKRAAVLGAGAAAAGGLAAIGTSGVAKTTRGAGKFGRNVMTGVGGAMTGLGNTAGRLASTSVSMNPRLRRILGRSASALKTGGSAVTGASSKVRGATAGAASKIAAWGGKNTLGQAGKVYGRKLQNSVNGKVVSTLTGGKGIVRTTDKLSRVSNNTIARIGAGAIGAGLAAGAARNVYKAATAQKKAAKFRSAMNETFKGTKYANGGKRRRRK